MIKSEYSGECSLGQLRLPCRLQLQLGVTRNMAGCKWCLHHSCVLLLLWCHYGLSLPQKNIVLFHVRSPPIADGWQLRAFDLFESSTELIYRLSKSTPGRDIGGSFDVNLRFPTFGTYIVADHSTRRNIRGCNLPRYFGAACAKVQCLIEVA